MARAEYIATIQHSCQHIFDIAPSREFRWVSKRLKTEMKISIDFRIAWMIQFAIAR